VLYFQQERQEAQKLFATENGQPAEAPAPPPAKTFTPGEIPSDDILEDSPAQLEELPRKGPTPEQIIAIKVLHLDMMLVLFQALFGIALFLIPPAYASKTIDI
jgi:hypothetical protein